MRSTNSATPTGKRAFDVDELPKTALHLPAHDRREHAFSCASRSAARARTPGPCGGGRPREPLMKSDDVLERETANARAPRELDDRRAGGRPSRTFCARRRRRGRDRAVVAAPSRSSETSPMANRAPSPDPSVTRRWRAPRAPCRRPRTEARLGSGCLRRYATPWREVVEDDGYPACRYPRCPPGLALVHPHTSGQRRSQPAEPERRGLARRGEACRAPTEVRRRLSRSIPSRVARGRGPCSRRRCARPFRGARRGCGGSSLRHRLPCGRTGRRAPARTCPTRPA